MEQNFDWKVFLQPYELAVEEFMLKMEGIKYQYQLAGLYCPIEIISGRVKTPNSILDKAKRMGVSFENINKQLYDLGGIRITCKYLNDVYEVKELLTKRKDLEIQEIRDYIKNPKPSGYRSLHIIARYNVETIKGTMPVVIEFQIRTHAMHFWASIEHSLKYKYQKQIPDELKTRLICAAEAAKKLDEEMTNIRDTIKLYDEKKESNIGNLPDPFENEVSLFHNKLVK